MASPEDTPEKKDAGEAADSGSPASDLPAHLQLPNLDFSLPALPPSAQDGPGMTSSGTVDLPAHLQLPSFPDVDMASLGNPPAAPGPDGPPPLSSLAGGPPPPPRKRSAAGGPPSRPPPRTPTAPSVDMSLPTIGETPRKRNLTLISTTVPSEVLRDGPASKNVLPILVGVVLVAAAVTGIVAREPLLAMLHPKPVVAPTPPPPTPEQEARKVFAAGVQQFTAKDFPKAIEAFEHALQIYPGLADAHRSLGIVYATLHEQAKAVDHYRSYLELTPKAPDATEVQKIIDDYAHAQTAAAPAPAAAPVPEAPAAEKPSKKAKAKHHGKH